MLSGAFALLRWLRVVLTRRYRPPHNPEAVLCRRADLNAAMGGPSGQRKRAPGGLSLGTLPGTSENGAGEPACG